MIKKVLKISLISLLVVIFVLGGAYAYMIRGVPLQGAVVMGRDNIVLPDDPENYDTNIKAMSYNIRLITGEDIKEHYWVNRKEHIIDLLEYNDADIIGFQEVTHPQYNFLIERMGDEYDYYGIYRSGLNRERGDRIIRGLKPEPGFINNLLLSVVVDEGSPIFYRKSRFQLLDYNTFWLRENPERPGRGWDASIRRICSYVKLLDHYTDEIITVYNTHFDHRGDLARQKSADLIYEYIMEDTRGTPIAMGDFNIPEGGEVYESIVSRSLSDTKFLSPEAKRDSGPTFNGFGRYPGEVPIDFIFTDADVFNVLSYSIITDKYDDEYYISDHYPVFVELEYK